MPQTKANFRDLCLGARFRYPGREQTWVKIGPDTVAKWDSNEIVTRWIGQPVCGAHDQEGADFEVALAEEK